MLELAMKMVLCLLIAAILGGIIGFLLGRISRCEERPSELKEEDLSEYAKSEPSAPVVQKAVSAPEEKPEEEAKEKKHPGIKPLSLDAPRNGIPDDLKEISGIGLKIEEALNNLGIYHFDQIANWTQDNINWIDDYLAFKGRVTREDWVSQAKLLAAGGSTEFSRKVKKGEVDRYKENKA